MHRLEMNDIDQHIARVCDPATANRTQLCWHNPHTGERWLVARVLPSDVGRFKEALQGQGCQVVGQCLESGDWPLLRWLKAYMPDAPLREIADNLRALGAGTASLWH